MRNVIATALLVLSSSAAAQGLGFAVQPSRTATGPDSIPRDLVLALLRQTGVGSGTEFFVGKVPPALEPFMYIPRGARVLGGYTSPYSTTVVLSMPSVPFEQIGPMFGRELQKLGWAPPPSYDDLRGWGFVPSATANATGSGLEFCHIGQSLQIMPSTDGPTTTVVAQVQNFGGRCSLTNRSSAGGRPAPSILPTVTNPVGALMNGNTCLVQFLPQAAPAGTSERLQTAMSPSQLLEHFGKQLADSGFATVNNVPAAVRRQWTRPDSTGATREVTITATPMTGNNTAGCMDVSMSVRVLPAARRP